ncbi:MAG: alanine--glyoxylate aminotransferase family protein [Acidobacteria bacterium]|nr:alanine--glyoxylate aminotransferase family protein [Acidobacteriota bacterium]
MQEPIRFFLPGPAYVLEEVRQAMTRPVVAHRSTEFREVYGRLSEGLPKVFRTDGEVLLATGSSTLLMESSILSLVRRDVLNLTNGAFSERWHEICRLAGRQPDAVAVPWGEAADPDLLRQALRRKRYEAVTVVHCETSTGVVSPVAELARVVREESDALLLVDAVSSLGGAIFETDAWGVDLVLVGVQKALAVPPGLVLFTLSERAARQAETVPHRGLYTDLLRYQEYHRKGGPITTPAIPLVWALDRQLARILDEGIESRWARHRALQERTAAWAARRGGNFASGEEIRSPTVSCLRPSPGIEPARILSGLSERGFTVASGYGAWKGSTVRIGHMGDHRLEDLDRLLAAVDEVVELSAPPAPDPSAAPRKTEE